MSLQVRLNFSPYIKRSKTYSYKQMYYNFTYKCLPWLTTVLWLYSFYRPATVAWNYLVSSSIMPIPKRFCLWLSCFLRKTFCGFLARNYWYHRWMDESRGRGLLPNSGKVSANSTTGAKSWLSRLTVRVVKWGMYFFLFMFANSTESCVWHECITAATPALCFLYFPYCTLTIRVLLSWWNRIFMLRRLRKSRAKCDKIQRARSHF